VVAVDSGPDRTLYAGPVFSQYEFEMPASGRKTDAEWQQVIVQGRLPSRPAWTAAYLGPAENR
jgi:hypothetical protein